MSDKTISQLTAITALSLDDLLVVVNDPAGSPATRKITLANALKQIPRFLEAALTFSAADGALSEAVPAGSVVGRRVLVVTEAWDTAATLDVGVSGDADKYVKSSEINLQATGTYVVDAFDYESAEASVLLDFDHASATQGAATLLLEIVR